VCEKVKVREAECQESGENEPGSWLQRNGDAYRKKVRVVRFSEKSTWVVR